MVEFAEKVLGGGGVRVGWVGVRLNAESLGAECNQWALHYESSKPWTNLFGRYL